MSEPSVVPFAVKVNSMSSGYRIAHLAEPDQYWSGTAWVSQANAAIYSEEERLTKLLPERGCWEPMLEPEADPRQPWDRSLTAQCIAQALLSQHCREERVQLRRLQDLSLDEAKRFREAAEFITSWCLSPDRAEAAVLAAADAIVVGESFGERSIFELSLKSQQEYHALAIAALHTLFDTVKDVPSDEGYREALCRLLDVVAPKEAKPCVK